MQPIFTLTIQNFNKAYISKYHPTNMMDLNKMWPSSQNQDEAWFLENYPLGLKLQKNIHFKI